MQTSFTKDVRALVSVTEELGNTFEEESVDLIVLDRKEIAGPAAVETVRNVKKIGQEQFQAFTRECLVERTKSINDAIRRNKLKVFNASTSRSVSKGKQQLASLRSDVALFSRHYIGCQTRDGNLEEFFRHENQACTTALSDGESLRLGTKSDLLKRFEEFSSAQSEVPDTTCLVIDGTVIVQMLKHAVAKNFDDYAQHVFIPYLSSKLLTVSRLDLVLGGHVWGQTLLATPELPPPSSWGWIKNDEGVYEPHWTKLPKAAHSCYELVSCKCKKRCVKRCKFKKAALECTALCVCVCVCGGVLTKLREHKQSRLCH